MRKRRKQRRERMLFWTVMTAVFAVGLLAGYGTLSRVSILSGLGLSVGILAAVALLPFCRGRESLWTFVLTVPAFLPVNTVWCLFFCRIFSGRRGLAEIFLYGTLMVFLLISAESLVLCLFSRLIWKKQYRLFHSTRR